MPIISGSGGGSVIGGSSLIYKYTVSGSVKASIDTGVDTPQLGSNSWTGGDLLEIFLYARTDEAVVFSGLKVTVNNDTAAHYDAQEMDSANAVVAGSTQVGTAFWNLGVAGASAEASLFSSWRIEIPNFAGTVGFKSGFMHGGIPDSTAANSRIDSWAIGFRSTSAITRIAFIPVTAAKNFAVGTQLLIYKRTNV